MSIMKRDSIWVRRCSWRGAVLRVVLMFVDIVCRGERTTIISHHPLLPHDGGSTAENMKQREQDASEWRGSNRLRKHSNSNDIDTCAAQESSAFGIYHVKIHFPKEWKPSADYIIFSVSWISRFYNQSSNKSQKWANLNCLPNWLLGKVGPRFFPFDTGWGNIYRREKKLY